MDVVFDALFGTVFNNTTWSAILTAALVFAFLGWTRVPALLTYGLAALISLVYVVALTRGTSLEGGGSNLLILRSVGTAAYTVVLATIYWVVRNMFTAPPRKKRPVVKARAR